MSISANDKARFCFTMARHTQASFSQCQRLLRLAATLHRFDVERCNRVETEAHKRKVERIQDAIQLICTDIETEMRRHEPQHGDVARRRAIVHPEFTWEPMACAVVLKTLDGYSDQAGEPKGIGVPA